MSWDKIFLKNFVLVFQKIFVPPWAEPNHGDLAIVADWPLTELDMEAGMYGYTQARTYKLYQLINFHRFKFRVNGHFKLSSIQPAVT